MNASRKKVRRLFVANRGEILRRIALTCRRLGIETVALSGREHPPAYLTGLVDHFVPCEDETPALFLNAERMVAEAKKAGCDAVHPGFGFLSENAGFAALTEAAGLIWVGPPPKAIEAMGDKGSARAIAESVGVPCLTALRGIDPLNDAPGALAAVLTFAQTTDYPLLLKATMGGGGKGMRLCHGPEELKDMLERAASEALNSFGSASLIVEPYLAWPRHVEVQILADASGRVVALGDRDCSVQRRHQKIIEEAPAPGLPDATRKTLHEAAVLLAKSVNYVSAGTVEFLVDWDPRYRDAPSQPIYFLEMNTRLQVEHTVTEEVFGLDLVEWQLRIASGESMPADIEALRPRGHSIQARLYAEDVAGGFFPAPGAVRAFVPATGHGIRWEIGIDPVDVISERFDPMIAKLIATAATREQALTALADALHRTFLASPPANLALVEEILTSPPFSEGPVTTRFIGDHLQDLLKSIDAKRAQHGALAETLLDHLEAGALSGGTPSADSGLSVSSVTAAAFGGRTAAPAAAEAALVISSRQRVTGLGPGAAESLFGSGFVPTSPEKKQPFWYALWKSKDRREFWTGLGGFTYSRSQESHSGLQASRGKHGSDDVTAPVPGKVVAVSAEAGLVVEAGACLMILESMKMQFEITAARAGRIERVLVAAGEQVVQGATLVVWATGEDKTVDS